MNYKQSIDFLNSIPKFGKKNGLNNIKALLNELGNPQKELNYIHVAGTNGKGSVCAYISNILVTNQYNVGLFTSPHLIKYNERMKINNNSISDKELIKYISIVKEASQSITKKNYDFPSFFEFILCVAICYFKDNNVDFIIMETGLGGRLDATNIIPNPIVCAITKIGMDHVEILGNSIEMIAKEKAGIIKNKSNVVYLKQDTKIDSIIEDYCSKMNASLLKVDKDEIKILNNRNKTIDFSLNTSYYNYKRLTINTIAKYQTENVAIALAVVKFLERKNHIKILDINIPKAVKHTRWQGRMDVIRDNLIIDGAHNVDGMKNFVSSITELSKNKKLVILFSCTKDKAYEDMIKALCRANIDTIIITEINTIRKIEINELENCFKKYTNSKILIEKNITSAFNKLNNYNNMDYLMCCVGSLYLIGDIYKIINKGGIE